MQEHITWGPTPLLVWASSLRYHNLISGLSLQFNPLSSSSSNPQGPRCRSGAPAPGFCLLAELWAEATCRKAILPARFWLCFPSPALGCQEEKWN